MNTLMKWFPALALLALSIPAFSLTTYETSVTNQTTITVTNSQHGMNSKYFGVHVYNASSERVQPSGSPGYSYTIDSSSYELVVTFTSSFTGTVKLLGGFSLTSHARDFAVSVGSDVLGGYMRVCDDCSATDYALRSWSGKSWFTAGVTRLRLSAAGGGGWWRAWLEDQKVVFGYDQTSLANGTAICTGTPCEIRYNIQDYPSGSIPLGKCQRDTAVNAHWITPVYDQRP